MLQRAIGALALASLAGTTMAQDVQVTFENLLPSGGMAFTPVFFGLSGGAFDLFDPGGTATAGLEALAELGMTGPLAGEFGAADPTGLSTTAPGGPVVGGGSTSVTFNVSNPLEARFLSFASMVVPSNDLFVGNPSGIELFDAAGNFNGSMTIEILGGNVWDAGTEVNDADDGAAFLQGIDGTQGTDEGGTIQLFFDDPNANSYLASLLGRTTAPGFDITSVFDASTPIARITIVPTPATLALAPIVGLAMTRRRR